jgi:hypothetical protein
MNYPIKTNTSMLTWPFAILLAWTPSALASSPVSDHNVDEPALRLSRAYYLNDLIQPHGYTPGKNSFLFQTLHKGQRKTLLELQGSGSVRHLWSTWSIPGSDEVLPGRVLLRVFVDGQPKPSIVGTIDELCHAALKTGTAYVPFPAFLYKDAYNLYLPVYFSNGIRIEAEALDEISELYAQIDYRLDGEDKHSPRLVSESNADGLTLKYVGNMEAFAKIHQQRQHASQTSTTLACDPPKGPCELSIKGPGMLRELSLRGNAPPDLELEIYWDGEASPSVQAPTRYLFADFVNAAMESSSGRMTSYFPMPFRHSAKIVLSSPSHTPFQMDVDYILDHLPPADSFPYFHALFHDEQGTLGYAQYPVLRIRGKGLFVGMNLFDSGHNHGGGDAALIDAGTAHPLVLHGICGEDYFGFAWHHTGTMTPLTGAPVHERRYRLHLENPYPFNESIQFLFGAFAGLQPKSVAFWYQFPSASAQPWTGVDAPWKILGPLGPETDLPDSVSDQEYTTTVAINQPVQLTERWQDGQMQSGFLDLTYQFRHYTLTDKGTGFIPGASRTALITYVWSNANGTVNAILGHDDEALVHANGDTLARLPANTGFGPSTLRIPLRKGWNKLDLVLSNGENTNWRWSGLSFALESQQSRDLGLRFSSEPPSASPVAAQAAKHGGRIDLRQD